jgi:hypothetical protein
MGSSLYSLGADPTENTVSIVTAQQYFDCCLRICCRGNLFTESLRSNERPLWLRYSGFQASCHCMYSTMTNIFHISILINCNRISEGLLQFMSWTARRRGVIVFLLRTLTVAQPTWAWNTPANAHVKYDSALMLMGSLETKVRWLSCINVSTNATHVRSTNQVIPHAVNWKTSKHSKTTVAIPDYTGERMVSVSELQVFSVAFNGRQIPLR